MLEEIRLKSLEGLGAVQIDQHLTDKYRNRTDIYVPANITAKVWAALGGKKRFIEQAPRLDAEQIAAWLTTSKTVRSLQYTDEQERRLAALLEKYSLERALTIFVGQYSLPATMDRSEILTYVIRKYGSRDAFLAAVKARREGDN